LDEFVIHAGHLRMAGAEAAGLLPEPQQGRGKDHGKHDHGADHEGHVTRVVHALDLLEGEHRRSDHRRDEIPGAWYVDGITVAPDGSVRVAARNDLVAKIAP
jgi:hypothetical protein